MRIGYVLAEFPGATHTFNWREIRALEAGGLTCDLISTRKPSANKMSHVWTQEAMARTTYLAPPRPLLLAGGIWSIIRSGPRRWARIVSAILRAEGISGFKGRLRLAGLTLMGGELAWLARRRKWTFTQVHSLADTAHAAMFAYLISGQPYGLTLHADLLEFGPNQRNKWRHAAYAICVTHRLRDYMRRELNGSIPERIDVAPMGVELGHFTRASAYEPWTGDGPARVFSCGRLNFGKGHDRLIRAVRLLRGQGLNVNLRIGGYDDGKGFLQVLQQLIAELNLGDCVELLGGLSEPGIKQELERAHAFVLASRADEMTVAVMEAMAMSLPVVASRTGGIKELIDHGVDGLIVQAEPPEVADALAIILKDPAKARELGQAARRKIEQGFHSGISANTLLRYLNDQTPGTFPTLRQKCAGASVGIA